MRTINYITYDAWWDTDKTLLPDVALNYQVNVIVISPSENKKYPKKEIVGCKQLYEIEYNCRDRDPRSIRVAQKILGTLKKTCDYDKDIFWLLPGHNPFFMYMIATYLPKDRTIISYHDYTSHYFKIRFDLKTLNEWVSERIKSKICNKFSRFLFFSDLQCQRFIKDYPNKEVEVSNMPLKDFGPLQDRKKNERTFLFFGALQEYKRLDLFVEAANEIKSDNVRFIIAGQPLLDWDTLSKKIEVPEIFESYIRFIENEEVVQLFSETDFLVLPYKDSTQSGPALIAMNYGIPIIASDIEAFKCVVNDGENGFLFENGNAKSLAYVLQKAVALNDKQISDLKKSQERKREQYRLTCNIVKALESII